MPPFVVLARCPSIDVRAQASAVNDKATPIARYRHSRIALVRVPTKCSAGTLGNPNNRSLATVKANACATGAKYAKTPRADEDYVNYVRGSAGRAFRRVVVKGGRWR